MSLKRRVDRLAGSVARDDVLLFRSNPNWTVEDHRKALTACKERLSLDYGVPVCVLPTASAEGGLGEYVASFSEFLDSVAAAKRRIGVKG